MIEKNDKLWEDKMSSALASAKAKMAKMEKAFSRQIKTQGDETQ